MKPNYFLPFVLFLAGCAPEAPPKPAKIRGDVQTLAIVEVVKLCKEYPALEAAYQAEGKPTSLGRGKWKITGKIESDGKPTHSYVVLVTDTRPDGHLLFDSIVIDGKRRK